MAELPLWTRILTTPDPPLTDQPLDPQRDVTTTARWLTLTLPADVTTPLLSEVPAAFHGRVNDVLLTGLALALAQWRRHHARGEHSAVLVDVEGHGREEIIHGADLSRTVGWFTSLFPVCLDPGPLGWDELHAAGPAVSATIKRVKEQLRALPDHGLGFGLLRYLNPHTSAQLSTLPTPQLGFNYLGRFPTPAPEDNQAWTLAPGTETLSGNPDPPTPMTHGLELTALVHDHPQGPRLQASWSYAPTLWPETDVHELAHLWFQALHALVTHSTQPGAGGHTPTDFPLITLNQHQIDHLETHHPGIEDILPLTPMQEGLLWPSGDGHSTTDVYKVQLAFDIQGELDGPVLQAAAQAVLERHPNLRAGFYALDTGQPVQIIPRHLILPWREIDLSALNDADAQAQIARLAAEDYARHFDLSCPPSLRFTLIRLGPARHRLIMNNHHILLDGWSKTVILNELSALHAARGDASGLPTVTAYRDYLDWLARQDRTAAAQAWQQALAGLAGPTHIAPIDPSRPRKPPDRLTVVEIPPALTAALHDQARHYGLTLNTIIQGVWGAVLSRMTGHHDVVFGAIVSGRPPHIPRIETMVGLLIAMVPVRVRLNPADTLITMLVRLQKEQSILTAHHHLGLTRIQHLIGLGEIFDTAIIFENYPWGEIPMGDTRSDTKLEITDSINRGDLRPGGTHYSLTLTVLPIPELQLAFNYRSDLFDESAITAIITGSIRLLEIVAATPGARPGPMAEIDGILGNHRDNIANPQASRQ